MNGESVSINTLSLFLDSQKETNRQLNDDMKEIRESQMQIVERLNETNELLREDINTTKAILSQHIKEYDSDKKKFEDDIFKIKDTQDKFKETLEEREGVYRAANYIKWIAGIILAGGLTAAGAGLYHDWFVRDNPQVKVKKKND